MKKLITLLLSLFLTAQIGYCQISGNWVFCGVNTPGDSVMPSYITGVVNSYGMNIIENTSGVYNFSFVDTAFAHAVAHSKKWIVAFQGGGNCQIPDYLFCPYANFTTTNNPRNRLIFTPTPICWSCLFLNHVKKLLAAFAANIQAQPGYSTYFAGMKIAYVANEHTYECRVCAPDSEKVALSPGDTVFTSDCPKIWKLYNYTPQKMIGAIEEIGDYMMQLFPGKNIQLSTITGGVAFPSIDSTGTIYNNTSDTDLVTQPVMKYLTAKYGSNFQGSMQSAKASGTLGYTMTEMIGSFGMIGWCQAMQDLYDPAFNPSIITTCNNLCMLNWMQTYINNGCIAIEVFPGNVIPYDSALSHLVYP